MNVSRNLRMAGLGLIVAGLAAGAVLQEVARAKARWFETRRKLITSVQEPGAIITMLGIALLDASDAPELQALRRNAPGAGSSQPA
jgi:hypothetical protein